MEFIASLSSRATGVTTIPIRHPQRRYLLSFILVGRNPRVSGFLREQEKQRGSVVQSGTLGNLCNHSESSFPHL